MLKPAVNAQLHALRSHKRGLFGGLLHKLKVWAAVRSWHGASDRHGCSFEHPYHAFGCGSLRTEDDAAPRSRPS